MSIKKSLWGFICVCLCLLMNQATYSNEAGIEFFEKRVRPVLAENCYLCHGKQLQQGELALHKPALIEQGGKRGVLIQPGNPDESLLVKAIEHSQDDLKMPPGNKLSDAQIADLRLWIAQGAPMPDEDVENLLQNEEGIDFEQGKQHWSFKPLNVISPPQASQPEWVQSPIDAFVLAELEDHQLQPAPSANKQTLLRRVSYDLTGLPPTAKELEDFLADHSDNAFETVVNRLLASPHYGERMGRRWLDLVRYAETDGHEYDMDKPNMWRYRDYVIRAFNQDLPYDRFIQEHLAGDQLPNARVNEDTGYNEAPIGTGFMWLGDVVNSPVDPFKAHADRLESQIDVFGKSFLGLTVACARCHDHKFDPISQADYYALGGIFESSRVRSSVIDSPETQQKHKEIIQNIEQVDRSLLHVAAKTALTQTANSLLAVREIIHETKNEDSLQEDNLFEDFESGHYDQWEIEGEAFHQSPPKAQDIYRPKPINNWRGRYVADSYHNSSDAYTGTLRSKPFTIQHNYLEFLIGGGNHQGKTCVNLIQDGEILETATGKNTEELSPMRWDVRKHYGKEVQIEIVDDATGSWGHIVVDHINLTNGNEPSFALVQKIAATRSLNPQLLNGWLHTIQAAKSNPQSPFYAWAKMCELDGEQDTASSINKLIDELTNLREREIKQEAVYEDFLGNSQHQWLVSGDAFHSAYGMLAVNPFELLTGNQRAWQSGQGFLHSGRISPKFQGMMISPIFLSKKRYVHVRMAGNGGVHVVSDEFRARNHYAKSDDEFRWYTHDILMYENKRNYIEIVDQDPDGYVVVDQILFSDEREPPSEPIRTKVSAPDSAVIELLKNHETMDPKFLALGYQNLFLEQLDAWVHSGKAQSHADEGTSSPALLHWLMSPDSPVNDWQLIHDSLTFMNYERYQSLLTQRQHLEKQINDTVFALTMTDDSPHDMPLHDRGNHLTPSEEVSRGFLTVFANGHTLSREQSSGRLELAKQMLQTAKPLLARVLVNRIWQYHFGHGLVRTPDNFGLNGSPPSHPELLDYLADQLIQSGWSIKAMHRLMLLSSTYQMSNQANPKALDQDPNNELLHHMPVRRLEAEAIRDAMLAVSGQLNPEMFGPGILPYLTDYMDGRGRPKDSGPLDGEGRRSIYLNIRRNFMNPMFVAFDYPPPITTIGKRGTSTVPAQALTLLNNEFVYQQAEAWAQRLIEAGPKDPRIRITQMYRDALSRLPSQTEMNAILDFIKERQHNDPDLKETELWKDVCHTLFNMTEFIFLN